MAKVKSKNMSQRVMATSTPIRPQVGKGGTTSFAKSSQSPVTPVSSAQKKKKSPTSRQSNGKEESIRKRRYRPGTIALKEIRAYQRTYTFLIPKASFGRVVREITSSLTATDIRQLVPLKLKNMKGKNAR